jgi:hypothetical protein
LLSRISQNLCECFILKLILGEVLNAGTTTTTVTRGVVAGVIQRVYHLHEAENMREVRLRRGVPQLHGLCLATEV